MFKLIISLGFIGCLYASALHADPTASPPIESITFNAGTHTEFYNAVQVDETGSQRKFQFRPVVGAGLSLPLEYGFRFLPELNWVLPFTENGNTRIIKNLFMIRADFGYDPLEWLRLRAGTGLMVLNQHGRGGSTTVDNGNESSTFYYPDENHTSLNNTFDLGLQFMHKEWSVRFQTYTYSLFKQERRQLSYSLFLTYEWNL